MQIGNLLYLATRIQDFATGTRNLTARALRPRSPRQQCARSHPTPPPPPPPLIVARPSSGRRRPRRCGNKGGRSAPICGRRAEQIQIFGPAAETLDACPHVFPRNDPRTPPSPPEARALLAEPRRSESRREGHPGGAPSLGRLAQRLNGPRRSAGVPAEPLTR